MARAPKEEFSVDNLLKTIRADPKYKKFKLVVQRASERLKIENDRNEALALHLARTSGTLYGKKQYSARSLLEAEANDMAARSRWVHIRVQASIHLNLLDEACDAIKRHIFTQYYDELRGFSNEQQRKALVERVQGVAMDLITDGKSLLEMLDQLIKDVDQSNFSMGRMVDLLELVMNAKGKTL
jgi:hypothetical protein